MSCRAQRSGLFQATPRLPTTISASLPPGNRSISHFVSTGSGGAMRFAAPATPRVSHDPKCASIAAAASSGATSPEITIVVVRGE